MQIFFPPFFWKSNSKSFNEKLFQLMVTSPDVKKKVLRDQIDASLWGSLKFWLKYS